MIERLGLAVLTRLDPERAHDAALWALRAGLAPCGGVVRSPRLRIRLAGLDLPNPVGLAAGFDKNARAVGALQRAGFGWLEVGAATPRPQSGNPRPRLFRLPEDRAVINRFGFNNDGVHAIANRLRATARLIPVGLNLGANKDSSDRAGDYVAVLCACHDAVDFVTVNVSSPNTERLRDLQGATALAALLRRVVEARDALAPSLPVLVKIAPDLDRDALSAIAEVAVAAAADGIIATNTTLARPALRSAHSAEAGGLSGAPLFEPSTRVLAWLAHVLDGALPLIGVGGIASGADAYAKITAGASAVQLYSGLVGGGLSLTGKIARDLDARLAADGHACLADAVGTATDRWL